MKSLPRFNSLCCCFYLRNRLLALALAIKHPTRFILKIIIILAAVRERL